MNRRLALSFCGYCFSLAALILIALSFLLWWGIGTTLPKEGFLPIEEPLKVTPPPPGDTLSVVSYNIGHGQGIKDYASDYRDKETTEKQLSMVADAIKALDADIYLLQEVDLDSRRTFYINQFEFIKKKIGHSYGACALVWDKNYLPFPYWPPGHHLGQLKSANCILSRYPLSNHYRFVFDKPKAYPFWYNWGYIDRAIQRVDVDIGPQKIALMNIHLEAWDIPSREEQIKILYNYMKKVELPIILGGDFNTVLPNAAKVSGFTDDPSVNYDHENTLSWFIANDPQISQGHLKPSTDPFDMYTFRSDAPNRHLDHIFLLGKNLSFIDYRVGKEAGVASDHLPIVARIKYKP